MPALNDDAPAALEIPLPQCDLGSDSTQIVSSAVDVPSLIQNQTAPDRIIVDEPEIQIRSLPPESTSTVSYTFRPDLVIDGWVTDRLAVCAATVRGDSHRADGIARQDDFALSQDADSGTIVATVSDGVSSAKESHLGSTVVCRYVTHEATAQVRGGSSPDWPAIARGAAWSLVELAKQRVSPDADAELAERSFAATLSAAAIVPHTDDNLVTVSGICVGDCAVWVLRDGALCRIAGGKSLKDHDGPVSNEVTALPRLPTELTPFQYEAISGEVLILMSDGIGDPLGDGSGLVGELLKRELAQPCSLVQFGRITDFTRQTYTDDRTLVAIWSSGDESGQDDC